MEREFKLNEEILKFKMTNKTVFTIDEEFENFGDVVNGLMYGTKLYNNALKVMVCSCITRKISIEEFLKKLTSEQVTKEIVPFATQIYLDYMGVKTSKEPQDHKKASKKK